MSGNHNTLNGITLEPRIVCAKCGSPTPVHVCYPLVVEGLIRDKGFRVLLAFTALCSSAVTACVLILCYEFFK